MKSKRPGSAQALWQFLGSHGLTAGLGIVFIGFCGLSRIIAQEPRPFDEGAVALEKIYSPMLLYFFRQAGLTDLFRSGWFISVLAAILLNLVCVLLRRIPEAWKTLSQKAPHAIQASQLVGSTRGARAELYTGVELPTGIAREPFRGMVNKWASRHGLAKPRAIRDEGGLAELQLATEQGKLGPFWVTIAHVCALGLALSMMVGAFFGFEGRLILEEGVKVRHLEVLRGRNPRWPVYQVTSAHEAQQSMPGLRDPGFETQAISITQMNSPQVSVRFVDQGQVAFSGFVVPNHPLRFRGISFIYRSHQPTTNPKFGIAVAEVGSSEFERARFEGVVPGQSYELDKASFKVVDRNDSDEGFGSSIQIEYREGDRPPKRFWIFKKHPGFDEARRKDSRFHFIYESMEPRMNVTLQVVRDPGERWAFGFAVALLFSVVAWVLLPQRRYWFSWKPGKVCCVGSSDRMPLFTPHFEQVTRDLRGALPKVEAPVESG